MLRSWPIVAAADRSCPATSPTPTARSPSGRAKASYQSPPTSSSAAAGRYRACTSSPGCVGGALSIAACRATDTCRVCWKCSACSTATDARAASSTTSARSSSVNAGRPPARDEQQRRDDDTPRHDRRDEHRGDPDLARPSGAARAARTRPAREAPGTGTSTGVAGAHAAGDGVGGAEGEPLVVRRRREHAVGRPRDRAAPGDRARRRAARGRPGRPGRGRRTPGPPTRPARSAPPPGRAPRPRRSSPWRARRAAGGRGPRRRRRCRCPPTRRRRPRRAPAPPACGTSGTRVRVHSR